MNKLRGEVEVTIDGLGSRKAALNMNAMIAAQQVLDLPSFEALLERLAPKDGGGPASRDYEVVLVVLWAAIREYDPAITREEIGRHITWSNLDQALHACAALISGGMDLDATAGFTEAAAATPEPEQAAA